MRDFNFFHGAALARLVHGAGRPLKIGTFSSDNGAYVLDDKVGIYVKYSTSRMSPWSFTFFDYQQESLSNLIERYEETFLLLMCKDDGIAAIPSADVRIILDTNIDSSEWVRVERPPRGSYRVRSNDGKLSRTIPQSAFPASVLCSVRADKVIDRHTP